MNEPSANPVWVTLLCIARCVVPLLLLIFVSYILRKLGLVTEPHRPPQPELSEEEAENTQEGGLPYDGA